jgi:hypothetical protein
MDRGIKTFANLTFLVAASLALAATVSYGQDAQLGAEFAECQRTGDAQCMHRVLRETMTSPDHVAYCKAGSPTANNHCPLVSVWFYCSADMAAADTDDDGKLEIARLGRETVRQVPGLYPQHSASDMPANYLMLGDALFDLIEAEACQSKGDRQCLQAAARKVAAANEIGAYQKWGMRQCWPKTRGVPKKRITAVLRAAGVN